MEEFFEEEIVPILIVFDEELGLWSFEARGESGVAETKTELITKIWDKLKEWNNQ